MTNATSQPCPVRTMGAFLNRRACSETLFCVLDRAFDDSAKPQNRTLEERGCSTLAGGFMARGHQCGMLWGATLNSGAQVHRRCGAGAQAEAKSLIAAQRLVKSFRERNPSINCADLTVPNLEAEGFKYFFLKGGIVGCLRRAANYAPAAFADIEATLAQEPIALPESPVSCSAMLAKKVGASEEHTVMAAGFAGGIGLSGGGCGALGAAIWIISMNTLRQGIRGNMWDSKVGRARIDAVVDKFLGCSGQKFECSKIVGRTFANIDEHAHHLAHGGCAEIIETLARQCVASET